MLVAADNVSFRFLDSFDFRPLLRSAGAKKYEEPLTEDIKPDLYYHSASDKRKIPVFIKEVEPGKFKWEDESGQSDDWFETEEMAHEDFVKFIQNEIHNVVIEEMDNIDEAFEHPQNKEPHWYLCKHGIGPGALPKGVTVLDTVDDEENSNRVYVALDKVLTTYELSQFELKEAKPPKMMKESLDFFDTVTVILDGDDMWGGYSKKMEDKYNWYQGQVIFEDDPRLKEIGAKPGDTILCGLAPTDKFDDDIDFDIVPIKVLTTDKLNR
jgi:hypothetical protein